MRISGWTFKIVIAFPNVLELAGEAKSVPDLSNISNILCVLIKASALQNGV
jgi:hypothetical protein